MLRENGLFGPIDKVVESVQFLKDHEPPEGYYLAFSGGKDSICIKELADMAGVKYDAHFNNTTIEAPDLIYYIRKYHSEVIWEHPEKPLLRVLQDKAYPTRMMRWCCSIYKEQGGAGRRVVTGVRAAESAKRAGRRAIEPCFRNSTIMYFNPIINWSDDDVWEFITERELPYCSLYDEGWTRIGCLLCPMAKKEARLREAKKYPRIVNAYIKAFSILHTNKKATRPMYKKWANGEEMFWYWLGEDRQPGEDPDQTVLFE